MNLYEQYVQKIGYGWGKLRRKNANFINIEEMLKTSYDR